MPYDVEPRPRQKLIKLLGKEAQTQVFGEYIYTTMDVADFFGVKNDTVRSWISHGELRAARVGRRFWVRGSSIREFFDKRESITEYRAERFKEMDDRDAAQPAEDVVGEASEDTDGRD